MNFETNARKRDRWGFLKKHSCLRHMRGCKGVRPYLQMRSMVRRGDSGQLWCWGEKECSLPTIASTMLGTLFGGPLSYERRSHREIGAECACLCECAKAVCSCEKHVHAKRVYHGGWLSSCAIFSVRRDKDVIQSKSNHHQKRPKKIVCAPYHQSSQILIRRNGILSPKRGADTLIKVRADF
jgi:hypothetical protein